mmetsp:Transcript_50386/g.114373  ORF Transcript_50386/g.114373 Transcript_50386/m.114373 type:complete len:232 (-) Transcript_50386:470-1165(-)|eukprot:CAMPEP_0172644794 /NCGR_PEP_ID=MMETSP1068-20121228/239396_1 /TAXON_ID=35684 /ORGANISM="Pseudopedinella elastica, Strain CCMP716" /LENGTH=231 /DNA_ID=CAMNT_0013459009 /DNA_START=417 /DNA_END=1112 /DNA_ORIENTATION=-
MKRSAMTSKTRSICIAVQKLLQPLMMLSFATTIAQTFAAPVNQHKHMVSGFVQAYHKQSVSAFVQAFYSLRGAKSTPGPASHLLGAPPSSTVSAVGSPAVAPAGAATPLCATRLGSEFEQNGVGVPRFGAFSLGGMLSPNTPEPDHLSRTVKKTVTGWIEARKAKTREQSNGRFDARFTAVDDYETTPGMSASPRPGALPRLSATSTFGFGGINGFHGTAGERIVSNFDLQ